MNISKTDLEDLQYAKTLLENPSLAIKITNMLGTPIEKGFDLLPTRWSEAVNKVTKKSLEKALDLCAVTMGDRGPTPSSNRFHKLIVTATGAGGGAFGLAALPMELPLSTTIMLRSIVDIARSEGERIKHPETKLACMSVFALGSPGKADDAAETGYFAVRTALAKAVSEAAEYFAERGVAQKSAPAIARFIALVASRFGLTVSEKVAAQTVPVLGAAGGAIINLVFIDHFQDMARGHFIVRRLERTYSPDLVRQEYQNLDLHV